MNVFRTGVACTFDVEAVSLLLPTEGAKANVCARGGEEHADRGG
jgi:hypothetical protein